MASFLIETFIAAGDRDRFEVGVAGLRSAIEATPVSAGQIRHVRSYLVPRDEMGVHVVEAESIEAVKQLATLAGIEVDRVVAAIGVDPGRPVTEQTDDAGRPDPDSKPNSRAVQRGATADHLKIAGERPMRGVPRVEEM